MGKEGKPGGADLVGEKVPNAGAAVTLNKPLILNKFQAVTITCTACSADESSAAVGLREHMRSMCFISRTVQRRSFEHARLVAVQSIPTPDGLGSSNV